MEGNAWKPWEQRPVPGVQPPNVNDLPISIERPAPIPPGDIPPAVPEITAPAQSSGRSPEHPSDTNLPETVENIPTDTGAPPAAPSHEPPDSDTESEVSIPPAPEVGNEDTPFHEQYAPATAAGADKSAEIPEPPSIASNETASAPEPVVTEKAEFPETELPETAEAGGPPGDLPPLVTGEASEPGRPFGVSHFEERIPDAATQKEIAQSLDRNLHGTMEKHIEYADARLYDNALDLEVVCPEGWAHINIYGHALNIDFYHADGSVSGHNYEVTKDKVTRTDIDLSLYIDHALRPGSAPYSQTDERLASYNQQVKQSVDEEAQHGFNRLPIGPRQLEYIHTLLENAVPFTRSASNLMEMAIERVQPDAEPVSESEAAKAGRAFEEVVYRFTADRGYEHESEITASFKGKVSDDLGSAAWQAGYRRSGDLEKEAFVSLAMERVVTRDDYADYESVSPLIKYCLETDGLVVRGAVLDYAYVDGKLRTIATLTQTAIDGTELAHTVRTILSDYDEVRFLRNFLRRPVANRSR